MPRQIADHVAIGGQVQRFRLAFRRHLQIRLGVKTVRCFNQINRRTLRVKVTPRVHHHPVFADLVHRQAFLETLAALHQPHLARIARFGQLPLVPGRTHPHAVFIAPRHMVFPCWKMKAALDQLTRFQIHFQRISRIAARLAQGQQRAVGVLHQVRHPAQIHIVAEQLVKIRHRKQDFPLGITRTVGRRRTHAVHALRIFRVLMEMVHPRAVFLTKRNLPRVLHLRQNPVRQRTRFIVIQKTRTRFGMRFSGEVLRSGGDEVFEMEIRIGVGFHRREAV